MNAAFPWAQLLAVALGSAVGGVLRWLVQLWLNARWAGFPLGTLVVNCVGGLLIGMALAWFARSPNEVLRLLLVTGFLGGLTTFSAFTGESLSREDLAERLIPWLPGAKLGKPQAISDDALAFHLEPAAPRQIIARMLRNLHEIYRRQDDQERLTKVRARLAVLLPEN